MVERSVMVYRRTWLILVSGFFEPLFYLLSVRVGLSQLVGDVSVGGREVAYLDFVAPGLMAASAMNGAVYDSTMNVFFKLKYAKTYEAMLATPITTSDVATGEIMFALLRGQIYATAFLVSMIVLGLARTPWLLLALPASALIGLAFASVGMAVTTYLRSWTDFEWIGAVTMPIFLFSATFFPVSSYGSWSWVVQFSPLYHGVALIRAANVGVWTASLLGHIAVLLAISVAGLLVTRRRLATLLLT
jgi:lipooligosaccharide transport system permease protein